MAFQNYKASNNATSTFAAGISASATSLIVKTSEGAIFPSSGDFFLVLEAVDSTSTLIPKPVIKREIVKATARSGDTITITRSAGTCVQDDTADPKVQGTTAYTFDVGDSVSVYITNEDIKDIKDEVDTDDNTSNLVHKTGTETITGNKTLNGTTTFADDLARSTTNAAPINDLSLTNKKYVDDQITVASTVETTNKQYVAGEDLTAGDALYINSSDGEVYKTDPPATTKINFIGFADSTVTSGNDVLVNLTYDDNQSGLTTGDTYFLKALGTDRSAGNSGTGNRVIAGHVFSASVPAQSFTITNNGQSKSFLGEIGFYFFVRPADGLPLQVRTTYILQDMSNNTLYSSPLVSFTTSNSSGVVNYSSIDLTDEKIELTPGTQYKIVANNFYTTSSANRLVAVGDVGSYYPLGDLFIDGVVQTAKDSYFLFRRTDFEGDPGEITNQGGNDPQIAVGVADSTSSILITNKKAGGRIAKGTTTGSTTVTTGFYPKQVIYSDSGNTSCYLDEANITEKTQSGFTINGAYDRVAFG